MANRTPSNRIKDVAKKVGETNQAAGAFIQAIANVDLEGMARKDLEKEPKKARLANYIFGTAIYDFGEIERMTINENSFREKYYIAFFNLRKNREEIYRSAKSELSEKEEGSMDWYIKRYNRDD